jgi:hypothetical protein
MSVGELATIVPPTLPPFLRWTKAWGPAGGFAAGWVMVAGVSELWVAVSVGSLREQEQSAAVTINTEQAR